MGKTFELFYYYNLCKEYSFFGFVMFIRDKKDDDSISIYVGLKT